MDDFSKLEPTEHMLKWLADEPQAAIRSQIEKMLSKQVAGSELVELQVTSEPQWLTGAVPSEGDEDKVILVRTGVAFELALQVSEPSGATQHIAAVYTWVGVHLNDPQNIKQRVWFDIDGKLDEFGSEGELQTRVYFD